MEIRLQLHRQQMEIIIIGMIMELVLLTMETEPGRTKMVMIIQR